MIERPSTFASPAALMDYAALVLKSRETIKKEIRICAGPSCVAGGALEIAEKMREEIEAHKDELKAKGLEINATLTEKCTGCHGMCEAGPVMTIEPDEIFYTHVKPKHAKDIIEKTIINGELVDELLLKLDANKGGGKAKRYTDIPFYALQKRIALRNVGDASPTSLEDYLANGGFKALTKALTEMKPEDVVEEVDKSGIRGRGGAGFPTGRKWKSALRVKKDRVWLICNGDEGDPGAFMDRVIMDSDPYTVIEGMMIAAYALGATDAYIYVRHEYPLAVKHLTMAMNNLRELGLLGENILGTGFDFNLKLSRGGGAFVCGESSALMRSIEGKVGEPRAKYVRSVEKGLKEEPTVLNNVETIACIPPIIEKGSAWFASMGSNTSKGTKVFSLVGKVKQTGLVEVPMGRTLREIIYEVGGGIIDDRPFKAVQTGGPSGGCLPAELLDLPVDFDTLSKEGAMMGSGGMIVMDDQTCMVDIAKYFIKFLSGESCGKCVPCREGLKQIYAILDRITKGEGREGDIEKIEKLCHTMETASLCALGKGAPFPVLSTLRFFRHEFEEHINDKVCRAGVCKDLISYEINNNCTGCTVCARHCPVGAITGDRKKQHTIDTEKCISCGICRSVCKFNAVDIRSGELVIGSEPATA